MSGRRPAGVIGRGMGETWGQVSVIHGQYSGNFPLGPADIILSRSLKRRFILLSWLQHQCHPTRVSCINALRAGWFAQLSYLIAAKDFRASSPSRRDIVNLRTSLYA